MHSILFQAFLLMAIGICSTVNGTCQFTTEEIENTKAIIAYKQDNAYHLLRVEKVPVETALYMLCNNEEHVVATICLDAGNWDLPFPQYWCQKPMPAAVELIDDAICPGMMYRVGYPFYISFLELYRACYDKANVRAKFVIHTARNHSVVTCRSEQSFTTDDVISSADADSYRMRNIYKRFKELYGEDQQYVTSPSNPIIDIVHLAPSVDYLYMNNVHSTFKFINAIPQFTTINRGNWLAIENWVRNRVAHTGQALVITGALDVLSLTDTDGRSVPAYLIEPNRNPIPKWIYKVVIDKVGRGVFLTFNDVYDHQMPTPICKTVSCPDTISLSAWPSSGLTVCCDPVDFQSNVVPELKSF